MNKSRLFQTFAGVFLITQVFLLTACPDKKIRTIPTHVQPQAPSSDQGGGNGNGGADFIDDAGLEFLDKTADDPVFLELQRTFDSANDIDPCLDNIFLKDDYGYFHSNRSGKNRDSQMVALLAKNSLGCLGFAVKSFPNKLSSRPYLVENFVLVQHLQFPQTGKRVASRVSGNTYFESVSIPDGSYFDEKSGAKIQIYALFEYIHNFRITNNGNLIVRTDIYLRHTNGLNFIDNYYTLLGSYSPLEHFGTDVILDD